MKIIITILALAGVITLSGCSTSPMIQEGSTEEYINGYSVDISNYEKIPNKNVNIQFKVAEDSDIGEFRWEEVQEDVLSHLKDKGVNVTEDGRPVTVTLDHFIAWGSNHAEMKIARGYLPTGSLLGVGLSIVQDIAIRAVDRKVAMDKAMEDSGDGKHFVADVQFSIDSGDYSTTLSMVSAEAIYSYLDASKKLTAQAISEFFTGTE